MTSINNESNVIAKKYKPIIRSGNKNDIIYYNEEKSVSLVKWKHWNSEWLGVYMLMEYLMKKYALQTVMNKNKETDEWLLDNIANENKWWMNKEMNEILFLL